MAQTFFYAKWGSNVNLTHWLPSHWTPLLIYSCIKVQKWLTWNHCLACMKSCTLLPLNGHMKEGPLEWNLSIFSHDFFFFLLKKSKRTLYKTLHFCVTHWVKIANFWQSQCSCDFIEYKLGNLNFTTLKSATNWS